MTGNQKLALEILGFLPKGYIVVSHDRSAPYNAGMIYIDGKPFAGFRI